MKLILASGLRTAQGGAELHDPIEQKTQIPSKATAFQIKAVDSSIVRNKEGEPEQILNIETSSDIATPELAKKVHIYLLPKREVKKTEATEEEESTTENSSEERATEPSEESTSRETSKSTEEESGSDEDENTTEDTSNEKKWANADEITDEILEQATVVKFTAIPTEKEFARDRSPDARERRFRPGG